MDKALRMLVALTLALWLVPLEQGISGIGGGVMTPILQASAGAPGGSFAFVAEQANSTAGVLTATCNTGELCVLSLTVAGATGTISGVTDATGDSWTQATSAHSPNNVNLNETGDIWFLSQPTHTGTHSLTITAGGSGTAKKVVNQEFTGQFTGGSPLDVCNTGQNVSTTNPSVSLTASASNELLIGAMVSDDGAATQGTGFTMGTGSPGAQNFFEYWERKLAGASGSNTISFSGSFAADYSMSVCAFKHN